MRTQQLLQIIVLGAGLLIGASASAAPGFDLQVNRPKLLRDHKELVRRLATYASTAEQDSMRRYLRGGGKGYIYGDSGSMQTQLWSLESLRGKLGITKPVNPKLRAAVERYGSLVDMQHGLKDASLGKRSGNDSAMRLGLGRAVRSAQSLNMSSAELRQYLSGYGLTSRDVERHTEYRLP